MDRRLSTGVAGVVAEALDVRVAAVELMEPDASSRRTLAVTLADGRVVVAKVARPGVPVGPTVHNLEVLGGLGVPVPQVLAVGRVGAERSGGAAACEVVVMSRLAGRDLHRELPAMTREQLTVLAREVTAIQRLVSVLPVHGRCGYVTIGQAGRRTWLDVVRHPNTYEFADPAPGDCGSLTPRLWPILDAAADRLLQVRPVCFLDDLTTKNVLISEGRLSGVVDFDWICQGDVRFHPGLTAAAVVTVDDAPQGAFYVAELIRWAGLDVEDRRFVDLYTGVFLINFLGAEWPTRPGPWRARAVAAAGAALDRAAAFFLA